MRNDKLVRALIVLSACLVAAAFGSRSTAAPEAPLFDWWKVVNKNDAMPGTVTTSSPEGRAFNSFNQPSVNGQGLVVFRARSRGGPPLGPPTRGIYTRDMSEGDVPERPIGMVLDTRSNFGTKVPGPNNLDSAFTEFPSVPRVALHENIVATRGNHPPVWRYFLSDGTETRAGTSGVYASFAPGEPSGQPVTAASKLGAVTGFELFRVPGASEGTFFDVFPGAPAVTDEGVVAFKGNFTESVGGLAVAKTGVFYRGVTNDLAGGTLPIEAVATTDTEIPNVPRRVRGIRFGSTAPPSAASEYMVFLGLDVEEAPTYGGIYRAPLLQQPSSLETLVGLGSRVPGTFSRFNRLGEGLSFDGRYVGFWGAWGARTKTLWLDCPTEGNKERIAFCLDEVGNDFPVEVPAKQGIFVLDTETGLLSLVARTGWTFSDFVFWNFSGRVPGGEDEEDGEMARWRSSSFVAVSRLSDDRVAVAFKARRGRLDPTGHDYVDPLDGIYLREALGDGPVEIVVDTRTPGPILDAEAPLDSLVTEVGLERDGFRGGWLAISASMRVPGASEEDGMAGIYLTRVLDGAREPSLTSPAPGATLAGGSQLFRWTTNGARVIEWWLFVGSRPGGRDYFDSGSLGVATFAVVSGLPTDGSNVHVRLWYRSGPDWEHLDATYRAQGP